ncbi:penicillin-binding protein 1A [Leptolyngbya sp. FACHB-36]|uniref:PBP1A family penicillin-binding protein n=1 Tax=Leptolyngbya sp. FACHB-36 TaxID=2692808 RepID=UPI0016801EC7|nr:penicillin-binding protein 1A [Leptolyngbya sp. FACHB-36]
MENFLSKLKNISTRFNGSGSLPSDTLRNEISSRHLSESESQVPARSRNQRRSGKLKQVLTPLRQLLPRTPLYRNRRFWLLLLLGGGGGVLAWGYWTIERSLPNTADISSFVRDRTLTIRAADGSVLQQLGPATRDKLTYAKLPARVVKAFVAAEDRRFYQHNGVDYQSIVRALASNLVARDVVEGASTITQQLARVVYLNQERSMWRKLQEAFLAQKIERELSKPQILEKYLNLVYLGSGAYGVADAAWVYFGKTVDQLTLAETAMIAGLPPAPSEYSPIVNRKSAEERRGIVLDRMVEQGYISSAEAEAARAQPITLNPKVPKKLYSDTPYFTSFVQQELPKYVSKEQLEIGGLTVETTLHPQWQKAADRVVRNAVQNAGPSEGFGQAALVAINPRNGEIRAMVGGTDFAKSQFNRVVQAQRQPGSSFKTILYTTAIATGMSPWDSYQDAPLRVDGYEPQNYSRKYNGWMSLRDALTSSINIISVRLILDVGFDPVINMAKGMGIKSKLMPTYSLALGASEVNLLELTGAYGTLAAQGEHVESHAIRRIVDRKGQVLYDGDIKRKRVVDKVSAAIMTWMMQNVVNSGTGRAAQLGRPVAGKTGTSEKARDLWFVGFIPQVVTGVWLGNDDNSPTYSYSSTAATVWHDFMKVVVQKLPVEQFPDVPKLEGRKGSIKAKKINNARIGVGRGPEPESEGYSGGSERSWERGYDEPAPAAPSEDYSPREEEPPVEAEAAPEPAPADPEPAPADPEPVAPPPENTAPAPEPAAEPAPAAPAGN